MADTRPDHTIDDLFARVRAFQESRILLTAVELDVFTAVGGGATARQVASRVGAEARATEVLLNALVAIGLLTKREESFRNTALTGRALSAGGAEDSRAALLHQSSLWRSWSTLTECVRAGTAVGYREMAERDEHWTAPFIAAMHRNAAARAPAVVKAVGIEGVGTLLDVGGGSAAYAIAFAQASPTLHAHVLDLDTVVPIARQHVEAAGVSHRVEPRAGDLRHDPLGEGYDLVLVSAICHMLGPDENRDLFGRGHAATAPNGRIVVHDFILDPGRTAPAAAALFSVNMLVGTPRGGNYTEEEYRSWLHDAGYRDVRRVALEGPMALMIGRRG
jgi:predicted O-methyltransferase YrrM